MGHLRKRGNGWELRVSIGGSGPDRQVITRTFRGSKRDAVQALAALELEMGTGAQQGSSATVAGLVELYVISAELSPTTLAEYRRAQAAIPKRLASMPVWKVHAPDLNAAYREMAFDQTNVHTIRRTHEVLSAAFGKAIGWGWVTRNPAEHASPPPRPRSERGAAGTEDIKRLLAACPPKLALWVRLAFVTGARRGEVCALQWKDVNLERGVVVVRRNVVYTPASGLQVKETKTGKVHAVALDAETMRLLAEHWKLEADVCGGGTVAPSDPGQLPTGHPRTSPSQGAQTVPPDRWLFTHTVDGKDPWRPDYVTLTIGRLMKNWPAERKFPIHSLRHGTATQLLDGGFALGVASERLGHDNQTTTARIYAHALPARDHEAADYLGGLLDPDDVLAGERAGTGDRIIAQRAVAVAAGSPLAAIRPHF